MCYVVICSLISASFHVFVFLQHMKATAQWTKEQNKEEAFKLSSVFNNISTFPQPVIAMINGPAYGGGVGIISACDMAFAVKSTVFALSEVTLGVIPATISPFVVSKIGATACRRYFVTAERFGVDEARRIGLINDIVEDQEALDAWEQSLKKSMMRCSPAAICASKDLIASIEGKVITDELREYTAGRLADVRDSPDGQEGMGAFLEKRKPSWTTL
jgi:methylglutaconyl-CoA hydratase